MHMEKESNLVGEIGCGRVSVGLDAGRGLARSGVAREGEALEVRGGWSLMIA